MNLCTDSCDVSVSMNILTVTMSLLFLSCDLNCMNSCYEQREYVSGGMTG